MRRILVIALCLLWTVSARAEEPQLYLRCVGVSALGEHTKHTVALYALKATVDGTRYELSTSDGGYLLTAPNPLKLILPDVTALLLFRIDRITGDYELSGALEHDTQHEVGHCVKMRSKF